MIKKIFIAIFICILAGAAVLYFLHSNREGEIANKDSSGTDIIAFGDSLTFGVGATAGNNYVSLLSKRLGISIRNEGRSGDTSEEALSRLDKALGKNPRLVIVLLGGNDYLRRVPIDTTFATLDTIVKTIEERRAMVLLVGIKGGIFKDDYVDYFEALSEKYKTGYVSAILNGVITEPDLMYDSVHPNDKGYMVIADKIEPVLRHMLEKKDLK